MTAITSFKPTSSESAIVDQIFDIADTRRIGSISSHAAVKIFSGTRLSPSTLADIWRIANVDESDMLGRQVVGVVVRLIGHAQQNSKPKVSEDWVKMRKCCTSWLGGDVLTRAASAGPLANIEGLEPTTHRGHNDPVAGPSSSGSSGTNLPPLTPEDHAKFMKIFTKCAPANGILNGASPAPNKRYR